MIYRLACGRLACGLLMLGLGSFSLAGAQPPADPKPNTPIKHLVVLMQQNRTFDHYFGSYPGSDGPPPGVCMPFNSRQPDAGECVKPYYLGDDQSADLAHNPEIFGRQFNGGAMNGFVHALRLRKQDGALSMAYYDDRDLPYYWNLADEFVLFDRFFSSAHAGSIWNRLFWVAGQVTGEEHRIPKEGFGDLPTIFDRLQEKGVSWKFYVNNYDPQLNYRNLKDSPFLHPQVQWVPLLSFDRFIDDPKLSSHIVDMSEYFEDLRNGTLHAVSYMLALGATEHPPAHPEKGQRFVRKVLQPLISSEMWNSSAFILTYDDWGGWYDHVPPPQVDRYGYGFRVPTLLVSPYAKRGYVDSTVLDSTSILKFIEQNYGLKPLATRDARANSIAGAFDFTNPPREAEFFSFSRETAQEKAAPRIEMIYATYGGAVAVAVAVGFFASVRSTRTRRDETGVVR
ncbi:MAG: Acid phosphatase [uncultured Truepera sp.]|uniref:Acid phosphatase n=1 Tax=uncultured Truepera sp. TaxID=543023 RepID=A0A6J4V7A1_9DEIN|nr:MAG: Acid phosphatase [uncultured Truepera sp.]